MTNRNATKAGSLVRLAGGVCAALVGAYGFYISTHADFPLDLRGAIYCVAATAMACWVVWMLANMAQQMLDGSFVPRLFPTSPPGKPDAGQSPPPASGQSDDQSVDFRTVRSRLQAPPPANISSKNEKQ